MTVRAAFFSAMLIAACAMEAPTAAEGMFPWKAGDHPPSVAGIALGDSEQHVRQVLGEPTSTAKMGAANILEYQPSGLEITATKADGVSIIRLRTPQAGAIDGIKIGDSVSTVIAKWGNPSDGHGRVALFNAGVWTVEVRLADDGPNVVDILLAWNTTKWPDLDASKAQAYRPQ
ncbi:MAG TPA: hypothetical protein VMD53_02160 [Rhizomicrobium sp.]|nr:hypothetical protein [Rhizomicrobium sp.]